MGRGVDDRGRPPAVLGQPRPECEPVAAETEDRCPRARVDSYDRKAVHLAADPARIDQLDQPHHVVARRAGVLDHLECERSSPRNVQPGHVHRDPTTG